MGVDISQRKIGGLFAYWILKFHPLSVDFEQDGKNLDYTIPAEELSSAAWINQYFAAYILYTHISEWYQQQGEAPLSIDARSSSSFHKALLYAFKYRNISIDAMMLVSESIIRETFMRPNVQVR